LGIKNQTTKEFKIPTEKTKRNQREILDRTKPLFSDQPFEAEKPTGTPTTRRSERMTKENKRN